MNNINTPIPSEFFQEKYLEDLAIKYADAYQNAKPFSHVMLDNFFPEEWLNKVLKEFPDIKDPQWQQYKSDTENGKFASNQYRLIPPVTRYVLGELNTAPFLEFLEKLTGIIGLIPDPYYKGGGMHQTKRGGWLGIHVDFNHYDRLDLYRRINVILYLNRDWKDEYGGHLELWDEKMTECTAKIAPIFNRCVIFTTSENSHHGHPDPLTCPEDMTRKSLAWYYYTKENGEKVSSEAHSTLFKARPGKDISSWNIKEVIRACVPPVIFSLFRKIKK